MIRHLQHHEIDKALWDLCITQSENGLIYGYSWYLDIVSPNWEALVLDDYEAVFPLTHKKKIFRYLYQPFFTQQLGLFHKTAVTADTVNRFIEAIPAPFKWIDIQLNAANKPNEKWTVTKRTNFLLDLNKPYEKLAKAYSQPTKKNIKKCNRQPLFIEPVDSDTAVDKYIQYKGDVTTALSSADYKRLKQLFKEAEKRQHLLSIGIFNEQKELLVSIVLFTTVNRIYLMHSSASPKGRKARGMYFGLDYIIQQYAGKPVILDFEGSDIRGVADFNKGFGTYKQHYSRLRINRLPWYIKWLKN